MDEARAHKSLANFGPGAGYEDCGHLGVSWRAGANATRARTPSARRAISSSGCRAVKAKRSRAVPTGTVGGRIAVTRKPSSASFFDAFNAAPGSPRTSGTIGLCASGRARREVNARALARGFAVNPGSLSMIVKAAIADAAMAGGRAVE